MPTPLAPQSAARRFVVLSACPELWGGSEELWFEAALDLRDHGHVVGVLKTGIDPLHPRVQELEARGCTVGDLSKPGPRAAWRVVGDALPGRIATRVQLAAAAGALLRRKPDLAIVSQGLNFDGAHLAWLCARVGVPYVLVSQKASELYWPPDDVLPYVRRAHERARASVFVCEHNLRLTERQIGGQVPAAHVLANPLLAGRSGRLPWPAGGGLRLACVGRMFILEKGQDLVLEVLARERWRRRDVHVSFYGQGTNSEALAVMARGLGVDNVSFQGHTPDIEDVWREHHALILPSRAEGSSLALQEAMACGRVPIVTDVGGNAELVEDEATGFVAPAPTVEAVDDALERAWERRDEWEAIGVVAAQRMAALHPDGEHSRLAALAREHVRARRRRRRGRGSGPRGAVPRGGPRAGERVLERQV